MEENSSGVDRWVGSDGALAIWPSGGEEALLNAGAAEADVADWSSDTAALGAHVAQYFESMGVESCQIARTDFGYTESGGGSTDGGPITITARSTTAGIVRGIAGIPVVESTGFARFDANDLTTEEAFYWPAVPAAAVAAAMALRDQLADPNALAAYKAKLPSDAQGSGQVVIHHSNSLSSGGFHAAATYDVSTGGDLPATLSFDANANAVNVNW